MKVIIFTIATIICIGLACFTGYNYVAGSNTAVFNANKPAICNTDNLAVGGSPPSCQPNLNTLPWGMLVWFMGFTVLSVDFILYDLHYLYTNRKTIHKK